MGEVARLAAGDCPRDTGGVNGLPAPGIADFAAPLQYELGPAVAWVCGAAATPMSGGMANGEAIVPESLQVHTRL